MGTNRADTTKSVKRKTKQANWLIAQPFEWTEKQKSIIETMNDKNTNCVIVDALAGAGKTSMAIYSALEQLQKGNIEKIVYVRTVVEAAHSKMGYLKGSAEEKFGPYAEVLSEKLKDFLTREEIEVLTKNGNLEAIPISFLRGRDLKNCIVIGDEMQNAYLAEIMTLATRISKNSKLFILADSDQCDLPKAAQNEFKNFVTLFSDEESKENNIFYFELKDEEDVKRSEFVKYISKKYRKYRLLTT